MTIDNTRALILTVSLLVIMTTSVFAGIRDYFELEANVTGTSTENIFKDFNDKSTTYSKTSVTAKAYPVSFAELVLTTDYTRYRQTPSLNNLSLQLGGTIIPLSETSKTQIYFSGHMKNADYEESGDPSTTTRTDFTSKNYDLTLSIGQELRPNLRLRGGYSMKVVGYDDEYVNDRYDHEVFLGGNTSFLSFCSLDLEVGYRFGDYDHMVDTTTLPRPLLLMMPSAPDYPDSLRALQAKQVTENLTWFYISPRLSAQLGKKTGVSLTYGYRKLGDIDENDYVFGTTTTLLSPWTSVYEGSSIQLKAKTHLVPKIILSTGIGYWDKEFLKMLEPYNREEGEVVPFITTYFLKDGRGDRIDVKRQMYIQIQYPIKTHSGYYLEPSLKVDYINNNSSIAVFEYDDVTVSMDFKVRF